jgi:hypothetical protein
VVVDVPICEPPRKTLYPVTATLSVDAVQARLICDGEIPAAVTFVGAVGAVVSLFTVSVAALLVTVPTELLTTTSNVDPLSEVVVAGVV